MQISRHWRLNANRYRLECVRYTTGQVSVQSRPEPCSQDNTELHHEASEKMLTHASAVA